MDIFELSASLSSFPPFLTSQAAGKKLCPTMCSLTAALPHTGAHGPWTEASKTMSQNKSCLLVS